jgi:hypothetical protein
MVVVLLLVAAAPATARNWTSSSGKFSVEAELVESKGGNVRLKLKSGKIITVPLAKLSKADQAYLKTLAKKKDKPKVVKLSPAAALAAVKALGADFLFNDNKEPVGVLFFGDKLLDDGLAHLKGMTTLTDVDLGGDNVTDAGMVHLKEMTWLTDINVGGTDITDAGLVHLKGLTKLVNLNLSKTKITDAGLVHVKGFSELRFLNLRGTKITDAGLVHLNELTKLYHLDLSKTQITDAGLKHLKELQLLGSLLLVFNEKITDAGLVHLGVLTKLQEIFVDETIKDTDQGVKALQKALPEIDIFGMTETSKK